MAAESNPNAWLWALVIAFLVLFVVSAVLWSVWASAVPSSAEGMFYYPGVVTGRKGDTVVNMVVKVRYLRGSKQGDLPSKKAVLAAITDTYANVDEYPLESTEFDRLGYAIAKKVYDAHDPVKGVSLQIRGMTGDLNHSVLSHCGYITPLPGNPLIGDGIVV
jgi:hypothetical protein